MWGLSSSFLTIMDVILIIFQNPNSFSHISKHNFEPVCTWTIGNEIRKKHHWILMDIIKWIVWCRTQYDNSIMHQYYHCNITHSLMFSITLLFVNSPIATRGELLLEGPKRPSKTLNSALISPQLWLSGLAKTFSGFQWKKKHTLQINHLKRVDLNV